MEPLFHNRTRMAESIPRKLIAEGKPFLLPVYYLMLLSDLAAEGIANSGSYRFADHVYAAKASGKWGIGLLLDWIMLRMPAATAMRSRYTYSKAEIRRLVAERGVTASQLNILAVPSGLARELFEVADELRRDNSAALAKIRWHGLDLDGELVEWLRETSAAGGYGMSFSQGDALDPAAYPQHYDMIVSLGLAEFVDDALLLEFYKLAHGKLLPGGRLVTSGMRPHKLSDYLLRNIGELHTTYRTTRQLRDIATAAGFKRLRTHIDKTGLQTMIICEGA